MKKCTYLVIALLLTTFKGVFGQETPSTKVKKFQVKEIALQAGLFSEQNTNPTPFDFQKLAPNSTLLFTDFKDYNSYSQYNALSGYNSYGSMGGNGFQHRSSGSPMISFQAGIKIRKPNAESAKQGPTIRVGFSYMPQAGFTTGLYKTDRNTFQKFMSNSGQMVYLDSVTTNRYTMSYYAQQLRFDGSMIYRSHSKRRMSLFAGYGITGGLSFNAHTEITHSRIYKTEVSFGDNNDQDFDNLYSSSNNMTKESHRNKSSFAGSVYVPLGVDWQLGKKRELWKQMHLFYEARPSLNVQVVPELRTLVSGALQHGFGIRYTWD